MGDEATADEVDPTPNEIRAALRVLKKSHRRLMRVGRFADAAEVESAWVTLREWYDAMGA